MSFRGNEDAEILWNRIYDARNCSDDEKAASILEEIKGIVDKGFDLDFRLEDGSYLFLLAFQGPIHMLIVNYFKSLNISKSLMDNIKDEFLGIALNRWDANLTKRCLEAGANPNIISLRDLSYSLSNDPLDWEPLDLMIKYGWDINRPDSTTPERCLLSNIISSGGNREVVEGLINRGYVLPTEGEPFLDLVFTLADHANGLWLLQQFVAQGLDVNCRDCVGRTPLMCACRRGHDLWPTVNFLINSGADVNLVDTDGDTALLLASGALCFNNGIFQRLLKAGASLRAVNHRGDNALLMAFRNGADKNITDFLFERGFDVNVRNKEGTTPLMLCVKGRSYVPPLFEELLRRGARLHDRDKEGNTLLFYAAQGLSTYSDDPHDMLGTLLDMGVNPRVRNKKGFKYSSYIDTSY